MGEITDPRVTGNRIAIGQTGFYDFDHPELSEFELDDILIGLSRIYRFTGQTEISVLQHSINVYHAAKQLGATREEQRQALFHDAHEAFVGDVVRPVMRHMRGQSAEAKYLMLEMHYEARVVIARRFGFSHVLSEVVDAADDHVLALEIRDEFDVDPATWGCPINPDAEPQRWERYTHTTWLADRFRGIEEDTRP